MDSIVLTALLTAVASVWGSYLVLQKNKDDAVQKERDRTDTLLKEAQTRSDKILEEERHRLTQERNDDIFATVRHYEEMLQVLKFAHGIDKKFLAEETRRTQRFNPPSLSESQITEISSDLQKLLEKKKEDARDSA